MFWSGRAKVESLDISGEAVAPIARWGESEG